MGRERREQILEEAMALADERGPEGLTMRGLAGRLGLTAMALYPYVGGREELLDALAGRLLASLPSPDSELPWLERLGFLARAVRDVAHRHPGCFQLLLSRPATAPDGVRTVERLFQALLEAGVPEPEVPRLERLLSTFVLGYALSEVNGRFARGRLAPGERRLQLPAEELPAHHRLAPWLDARVAWDEEFEADLADLLRLIARPF
jgi:AcrR family transcriptional regulator